MSKLSIEIGGRYLFTPNETSGTFTPCWCTVELRRERSGMVTQFKVKGDQGTTWWADEDELDEHPSVGFQAWKAKQGELIESCPTPQKPMQMIRLEAGICDTDRLEFLVRDNVVLDNVKGEWRVYVNGKAPTNMDWFNNFRDALDAGIKESKA